jgi:hypothetical protein
MNYISLYSFTGAPCPAFLLYVGAGQFVQTEKIAMGYLFF